MSANTARRYISAYDVLSQSENIENGTLECGINIQQLGVYKLSSLSKLTPEQQKQVIENAPLEEMIISHV